MRTWVLIRLLLIVVLLWQVWKNAHWSVALAITLGVAAHEGQAALWRQHAHRFQEKRGD